MPRAGVHEAEAGLETQCEGSAERVDFRQVLRRPIVTECPVAAARDAADVAQSSGIDVGGCGQRPRATLRPARHSELVVSQRVGDRHQVVGPAGVGACLLGTGLSHAGPVDADESQPILRCRIREQACLEPAAGSAVVVDDEWPVRISHFEIREGAAVSGRYLPAHVVRHSASPLPLNAMKAGHRWPLGPVSDEYERLPAVVGRQPDPWHRRQLQLTGSAASTM